VFAQRAEWSESATARAEAAQGRDMFAQRAEWSESVTARAGAAQGRDMFAQRAVWSESVTARAGAAKGRDVSILEVPLGFEPRMEALQASALPLGDGTDRDRNPNCAGKRRSLSSTSARASKPSDEQNKIRRLKR
jgi:hypothetical protein